MHHSNLKLKICRLYNIYVLHYVNTNIIGSKYYPMGNLFDYKIIAIQIIKRTVVFPCINIFPTIIIIFSISNL